MTTTLALTARLRAMPDDELVAALHMRPVRHASISDFFDLAEALLEPAAVQGALESLNRTLLAILTELGKVQGPRSAEWIADRLVDRPATAGMTPTLASEAFEALNTRLLAHPSEFGAAPYDAVISRLNAWQQAGLPDADTLLGTPPPPPPPPPPTSAADNGTGSTDQLAAERAFAAVVSISELLTELTREGARELQKGGLALPAAKRLAEALAVDIAAVPTALSVAAHTGLCTVSGGLWIPTDEAESWQHAATPDRWHALAAGWLDSLPPDVRDLLATHSRTSWSEGLKTHLSWLYPMSAATAQQRVSERTREAKWLGIIAHHLPSRAGTALLELGPDAAAVAMTAHFPAEVSSVYVQHDLTVISPGPLAPEVEARLRTMADPESRALASTFRFSPGSIDRAVTAGETIASIHEFLTSISLTGVPQPLDYVIADAVERHGRVRVRIADDGQALVYSVDAALLRTMAVDQSLSSLQLHHMDDTTLTSRFPRDTVFWALSDARYPVVAEDASGVIVSPQRRRFAERNVVKPRDPATELVTRLRQADASDEDTAEQWLARQLDHAVRTKQTVVVEVAMPDGHLVECLLEPIGIGGGRLRARDRAADIERTLPLSSIRGLRSVD